VPSLLIGRTGREVTFNQGLKIALLNFDPQRPRFAPASLYPFEYRHFKSLAGDG